MSVLLIHGTYHLRPRRVAFRNDFCVQCNAERTAIRVRTFDVVHIFWVPLIPLGFFKRWFCSICGRPPDQARTARRSIKIAALVTLAVLALAFWLMPLPEDGENFGAAWGFRIATTLALAGSIWWLRAGSGDVVRRQHLATLQPSQAAICPICNVNLIPGDPWCCPQCGMVRQ